jgi:hypothetical protein
MTKTTAMTQMIQMFGCLSCGTPRAKKDRAQNFLSGGSFPVRLSTCVPAYRYAGTQMVHKKLLKGSRVWVSGVNLECARLLLVPSLSAGSCISVETPPSIPVRHFR